MVIYNLSDYKALLETTREYVGMARVIVRELNAHDLKLEFDLRKESLRGAKTKILRDWENHKSEITRALE